MDQFQRLLAKYRGSHILLVDPEGGFGDQLILKGVQTQLTRLKIRCSVLHLGIRRNLFRSTFARLQRYFPELQSNLITLRPSVLERTLRMTHSRPAITPTEVGEFDAIVMNGGAYLNDVWNGYQALTAIAQIAKRNPQSPLIFAPQSFVFKKSTHFAEKLEGFTGEIHIFCREVASYEILKSLSFPENVSLGLSEDAAFYLSRADFDAESVEKHVLVAPRLDRESIVKWNFRLMEELWPRASLRFGDVNLLPSLQAFVESVAHASKVFTDRLHVSILSSILNKETYLLPNSYHKNKSVYDFSLKRFPKTQFMNIVEFPTQELLAKLRE